MMSHLRRLLLSGSGGNIQYFFDSIAGSDSNTGTSAAEPWATIGKATSAGILANGVTLNLKRGSHWREMLSLSGLSNVTVRNYGSTSDPLPVLNASDIASSGGWSKTAGQTNVYERSWAVSTAQGAGKWNIQVWENDVLLTWQSSIANCDANAGSFFVANSPSSSPVTVYIHASGGSKDPASNGKVYELGKRDHGLLAGTADANGYTGIGHHISGVCTKKQIANNGSMIVGTGAAGVHNCLAREGIIHNFWISPGVPNSNCCVHQCSTRSGLGGSTAFVSYRATPDANAVDFTDAYGYSDRATSQIWHSHTAGATFPGATVFRRCHGKGRNFGGGANATGYQVLDCTWTGSSDTVTTGCLNFTDANVTIDNFLSMDHYGQEFYGGGQARTWTITDARVYKDRSPSAVIDASAVALCVSCTFKNSRVNAAGSRVIFANGSGNGGGLFRCITDGWANIYNWSPATNSPDTGVDNNVFYDNGNNFNFRINGTTYSSFALYRAAFPSQDANSTSANPLLNDPSANDWSFSGASPADASGREAGSRKTLTLPNWTTLTAAWAADFLGVDGTGP